jgi:hypothetical protein
VSGSCEHGNEPSGSIKGGVLLDQSNDSQFLRKHSTPCNRLAGYHMTKL